MEVINYTDRSVAVFGNTKPYSDQLKQAGGRFNPSLKYGDDEETRRPGWIFPKTKENDIRKLVDNLNSQPQPTENTSTSSSSSKPTYQKSVDTVDKKTFMALLTRVERLEQELKLLQKSAGIKNTSTKNESVVFDDDEEEQDEEDDEEVVVKPARRLLKK
jgi:hypothetical protein